MNVKCDKVSRELSSSDQRQLEIQGNKSKFCLVVILSNMILNDFNKLITNRNRAS